MFVECTDNGGFEDQLTSGHGYDVEEFEGGSVLITNDKGDMRWYGTCKFGAPML
jgi:hypothetical protein